MHTRAASDLERLLAPGYVLRGTPDIDRATWLRNALALCWGDRADIDNFSATPLNDVVVASLTLTFYVDPSTCRPAVLRSLVTDVWSRSGDGWQLQVRHSGPPPVGSGVAAQFGAVPERPPIWDLKAELAMAGTRGNTNTSSIGSGATAIHTAPTSTSQLEFRVLRNRTDGVTRAQVLTGRGRHARNVGGRIQVFAASGYERDRFAGLAHQLTVTGGLSSRSTLGARQRFSVDGGLGVTSERRLGGEDRQFATATSALHYTWVFRLGSEFTHSPR